MIINASNVKVGGFTILTDGWGIRVYGDRAQIIGNIITTHFEMSGSHQTVAYNTINSLYYPNGTVKSYAHVDLHGSYNIAAANTLAKGALSTYGSYNTIFGNNVLGSYEKCGLSTSCNAQYSLIYGNSLKGGGGIGIAGMGIIVANNTITNSASGGVGIIWGGNNVVFGNNILNCSGAGLYETDNSWSNLFYANYVVNNICGVKITSQESNTTLYHNNFVNNINQFNCEWGYFDNGAEGNYWSNYLIRYPNASEISNTGIGDTPYVINENRADHYPLMASFDISTVTLQLPDWANLTLPSRLITPSLPPLPTPETQQIESFPITSIAIASASVISAIFGIGLLVYLKKRKH